MGALDEGHFDAELENGVNLGCLELGGEEEPDTLAIEDAVKVLLQGLGEDVNREGLQKTPLRVAKAFLEGTRGYRQYVNDIVQGALFPEAGLDKEIGHAGGAGGLVIVRDLNLFSYCESCLLPFQVKCHVGYVPSGQRVVGLSKLSRVSDVFAKRLQDPQRLADEIASALQSGIKPAGVAVVLQCLHIQFPASLASNQEDWVKIQVTSGSGAFKDEKAGVWGDFLSLLKSRGININKSRTMDLTGKSWCPSRAPLISPTSSSFGSMSPKMVTAVTSIIQSLGEDPSRKELVGTPSRFVKWLMNFQNTNIPMKLNGCTIHKADSLSNGEVNGEMEQIYSELNMPFWSQCEHHLLPFHGSVHIGYFRREGFSPSVKSLLQSIVHFYGFKLQVQERLTRQIAETVSSLLGGDVMVVVEAYHTCMISRGIEKFGSNTATIAVLGRFSVDSVARSTFLDSISEANGG